MKYKLGIYGSSSGDLEPILSKAEALADSLSEHSEKVILITGAGRGLPYHITKRAAAKGVEAWGFAAEVDLESLKSHAPDDDHNIYSKIIYVPPDFQLASSDRARMKYRNVVSTSSCDAAIIISGQWGTINEFALLLDLGKPVGVLIGTNGIADELPYLMKKISKAGQGEVIFDKDPQKLIRKLLKLLDA